MGLTTALFTGLSGLTVNQVALDVIGNNIANVNTTGFKRSRALFETQFSETPSFGSPPDETFGGTNPTQKGLGAVVGSIQRSFDTGNIQPTGVNSDLAIQGQGMFIVESAERLYTRAGTFMLNGENNLVNANGLNVMGYGADANFNIVRSQLQMLRIPLGMMTTARSTSNVTMGGTLRSQGDLGTVGTILQSQAFTNSAGGAVTSTTSLVNLLDDGSQAFFDGTTLEFTGQRGGRLQAIKSLDIDTTTTVDDLIGLFVDGFGVHTDATLPNPGGGAVAVVTGGYAIEITGNVGTESALSIGTGGVQAPGAAVSGPLTFDQTREAVGESVYTSMIVYDSLGNPIEMNVTMILEEQDDQSIWRFLANSPGDTDLSSVVGSGTVTFDQQGSYFTSTGSTVTIDRDATGTITPLTITLDFEEVQGMTVLNSQMAAVFQDGSAAGTLTDFTVADDGQIIGTFSNGLTRTIGQVAMATFSNYEGLVEVGSSTYRAGPNSGVAVVTSAGLGGAGTIAGGALETSNVDISNEFINMIIASTGFSASSRVITTSNQLLTELFSIVR